MDINFFEPQDVPQARQSVRVERVRVEPYPDGWRIRLIVDATPFQERPSLEIRVKFALSPVGDLSAGNGMAGRIVSELSIIETMHNHMEFTVHVRGVQSPVGDYIAEVDLYYEDRDTPQHQVHLPFRVVAGQQQHAEWKAD